MSKAKTLLVSFGALLMMGGCATTCETNPALQSTSERIFCGHKDSEVLSNLRKKLNELGQRATKIEQQIEEYKATLFMVGERRDSLKLKEDELAKLDKEIETLKGATRELEVLNKQAQTQIAAKKQQTEEGEKAADALQTEVAQIEDEVKAVESQVDSVNNALKRSLAMSLLRDN